MRPVDNDPPQPSIDDLEIIDAEYELFPKVTRGEKKEARRNKLNPVRGTPSPFTSRTRERLMNLIKRRRSVVPTPQDEGNSPQPAPTPQVEGESSQLTTTPQDEREVPQLQLPPNPIDDPVRKELERNTRRLIDEDSSESSDSDTEVPTNGGRFLKALSKIREKCETVKLPPGVLLVREADPSCRFTLDRPTPSVHFSSRKLTVKPARPPTPGAQKVKKSVSFAKEREYSFIPCGEEPSNILSTSTTHLLSPSSKTSSRLYSPPPLPTNEHKTKVPHFYNVASAPTFSWEWVRPTTPLMRYGYGIPRSKAFPCKYIEDFEEPDLTSITSAKVEEDEDEFMFIFSAQENPATCPRPIDSVQENLAIPKPMAAVQESPVVTQPRPVSAVQKNPVFTRPRPMAAVQRRREEWKRGMYRDFPPEEYCRLQGRHRKWTQESDSDSESYYSGSSDSESEASLPAETRNLPIYPEDMEIPCSSHIIKRPSSRGGVAFDYLIMDGLEMRSRTPVLPRPPTRRSKRPTRAELDQKQVEAEQRRKVSCSISCIVSVTIPH